MRGLGGGVVPAVLAVGPAPVAHPPRGDLLDLVLVMLALGVAMAGARRGLVLGVASAAGALGGGLLAIQLMPPMVGWASERFGGDVAEALLGQRVLVVLAVLAFALAVEAAAVHLARPVHAALHRGRVAVADAVGGALFEVTAFLLVTWLLASAAALAPSPQWRAQIRGSAVLHAVEMAAPDDLRQWSVRLNRMLQREVMPYFLAPFGAAPVPAPSIPPPDPGATAPAMGDAADAVVKVLGAAPSCGSVSEGSGFLYAPRRVMTNAHVVAGTRTVQVQLRGGQVLDARVVLFDPARDLAVLYVPQLRGVPLRFTESVEAGQPGVVAGYPGGGPFTAVPARIAGEQALTGPDIYYNHQVTREIYTLRARVRPGNSGGPLLTNGGRVAGVVFAASADVPNVGYALTAAEAAPDAARGRTATAAVSTHGCM
jgi:S1-C subfamily serine protease